MYLKELRFVTGKYAKKNYIQSLPRRYERSLSEDSVTPQLGEQFDHRSSALP